MTLFRGHSNEVLATIRSKIESIEKDVCCIDKTFKNTISCNLASVPAILERAFREEEKALATMEQKVRYGMEAKEILLMSIARGEEYTLSQCLEILSTPSLTKTENQKKCSKMELEMYFIIHDYGNRDFDLVLIYEQLKFRKQLMRPTACAKGNLETMMDEAARKLFEKGRLCEWTGARDMEEYQLRDEEGK